MNDLEKQKEKKGIRYILLLLLIFLIGSGIWIFSNYSSDNKREIELAQKKEEGSELAINTLADSVTVKSTAASINNEKILPSKNIESSPKVTAEKKKTPSIKKKEEASLPDVEKAAIISHEEPLQEATRVYKADKKIDGRLPASFDNNCNANTFFNISKASIQTSVAISPDGNSFAVGNHDNYVGLLNIEGKELIKLVGHKGYVQSVKYSPDGKFIVSGSMDHAVKLWDTNSGKEIKNMKGHTDGILCVAYSHNGKYIASGSLDHKTIIWDAKSGKRLFQLAGHKSEIAEVAFSRNNRFVITGSSDKTAKVWDLETGKIMYSLEGHDGVVGGVAITPNDNVIITSSDDKIRLWNAKSGKHIHTINDNKAKIMSIFSSNDGEYISSSTVNGIIKIWKTKGGKKVCEYTGHSTRAREAVFHPTKDNTVISVGNDKTIRMWEFEPK